MPLTVNEQKASFSLSGPDVEPQHWAWALAGPQERRAYYLALGQACYRRKILELARGIGVDGRPLKPVLPESRPDGAMGPPLSPHDAASRFQRYLARTPHTAVDRCTLYWIRGFAKVVHGHMVGWGHLPVRNVVGLTQRHFREAVAEARAGWAQQHGAPPPEARAGRAPRTATELVARYPHLAPFAPQEAGRPPPPKPRPRPKPKPAPPPEPPEPPPYGPSRATVLAHPGAEQTLEEVLTAAGRLAGRPVTAHDLASLTGATDDARVEVLESGAFGIRMEVHGPGYHAVRFLNRGSEEELYLENQSFDVEEEHQGQGLGARVFGRQVEQAAAFGVEKIDTLAAGSAGDQTYNGYYTWPRFGYDGPIPDEVKEKLPPQWAGAEKVSDLQFSEERRRWWKDNGETLWLAFDLREGSTSRLIWDAYRAEKASARTRKRPGR